MSFQRTSTDCFISKFVRRTMSPDLFFFSSLEPAEEPSPRDKPYVQASKDGDVDALIKFLAEDNFNPNAITPGIVLSLMFAAEEGYLDVIKILRDEVELDEQQLHIGYLTACARGQIEIVEYVLATPGVNINVTVGELHAMNENPPKLARPLDYSVKISVGSSFSEEFKVQKL
ncbi:unnamed protein product [Aphanomyces euteiches]